MEKGKGHAFSLYHLIQDAFTNIPETDISQ
jgi:hypothetical protein